MSSMSLPAIEPVCERLAWDSEFFGVAIGQVSGGSLTRDRAQEVLRWRAANGIACLYFLADARDAATSRIASGAGFRVVDVRCTYQAPIPARRLAPAHSVVRPFEPADMPDLERMASANHRDTRFYFDGHFDEKRCGELYAAWIRRSANGWADAVYVAERRGEPAGYVTCHIDVPGAGSIGLIGVGEEYRGQGLGRQLVAAAIEHLQRRGARRARVATQARNVPSQQLYQRSGFVLSKVEIWHHLWAGPKA